MSASSGGGLWKKGEVTNTWVLSNVTRKVKDRSGLHFPASRLWLLVTQGCAIFGKRELGPSAGQSLLTADIVGRSSLPANLVWGTIAMRSK